MRDHIKGGALTETTLLVLLATCSPMHGYGIMQFIENKTGGRVVLGAGTLYGAINTLQKKGWIEPVNGHKNNVKKNYMITQLGKQIASEEQKRLAEISVLAEEILGDVNV